MSNRVDSKWQILDMQAYAIKYLCSDIRPKTYMKSEITRKECRGVKDQKGK